jgi:hypothetical protein
VSAKAAGVNRLVLFPRPVALSGAERIAASALQHKLPMLSGWYNYADAGGRSRRIPHRRRAVWVGNSFGVCLSARKTDAGVGASTPAS